MTAPAPQPLPASSRGAPPAPGAFGPGSGAQRLPILLVALAGLALAGLVLVGYGSSGFPSNAPVESIGAFGIVIDLIAATLAWGIGAAVLLVRRSRGTRRDPSPTGQLVLAAIAAILAVLGLAATLAPFLTDLLPLYQEGRRLRFMYANGGAVWSAPLWVVGGILGGFAVQRRGRPIANVLGIVAVVCLFLVTTTQVVAALAYGADLTD